MSDWQADVHDVRHGLGSFLARRHAHEALDRLGARLVEAERERTECGIAYRLAASRAEAAERERDEYRIEGDHAMQDYEDAEAVIRQIAEARPNNPFDPWARQLCQEFIERPAPERQTTTRAERDLAEARGVLEEIAGDTDEVLHQFGDARRIARAYLTEHPREGER